MTALMHLLPGLVGASRPTGTRAPQNSATGVDHEVTAGNLPSTGLIHWGELKTHVFPVGVSGSPTSDTPSQSRVTLT